MLWTVGVIGVTGGALLWFMLTAFLPWGGGTWLAGLAFGGRWNAGATMLEDADPTAWERMVRLARACPPDDATELCEAAMAVRTAAPDKDGSATAPTSLPPRPQSRESQTAR
jgi:hypothetical protein